MPNAKGFIVHPTYTVKEGKAYIQLFGRLENGESFLAVNEFRPYFFIRKADLERAQKIEKFEHEETKLVDFDGEAVVKVILDVPSQVKPLREKLAGKGIRHFEADIRFEYRFMIDNCLQGAVKIAGEYTQGDRKKKEAPDRIDRMGRTDRVDRIYKNPVITPAQDYLPKNLKVLSLDIETDMRGKKIYAVSVVCGELKKVLIVSDKKLKHAESFESEEAMLSRFSEILIEEDPDIITGWSLINFDLVFIENKFRQYKLPFKLGRTDETCTLRPARSFFQESKADFPGRMVLDGIALLKNNFVSLDDYKLETAAQTFLGESKLIGEENKAEAIDEAYKHDQQLLVDYNLKDSELVIGILEKSTALGLCIQRSLLTGMPLDRVRASIASLDSLYLKELRRIGVVAPTAGFEQSDDQGKGGYVMSSKPGIYDYVIVCDFKSLYPSIVMTFNIDPWSYLPDCKEKKSSKEIVVVPSGAAFKNQEGILPRIISHLWQQRDKAKKEKNELARYAIKILMNSFYGVLANPTCRFYSREVANAITLSGQHLIKLTAKRVEEMGYEVIYGDTDSIFVHLNVDSHAKAHKIGNEIAQSTNKFFEKHMHEDYCRKNHLELEFEKVYKRFIMPTVRNKGGKEGGKDIGSKKRYAGLLVDEDGKEKMNYVGLEFVRRDWTDLAKEFQAELLGRIFHKKEVGEYIRKFVEEVRAGKHDSKLVYRRAIRKGVEQYTKTTPPHVKAARILGDDLKSSLIEYVMTLKGPEPIQKLTHKPDYEHYIEKQLKPIADTILGFYDQNFDDILKGASQKTLFGY